MIDALDNKILNIIQCDARVTNVEIARRIDLAPSAVLERVRKLEERGLIRDYTANLDARQLGFGLTAFVFVRTEDKHGETAEILTAFPEVLEVHHVAGEDCYLVKVKTVDTEALGELLREKIGALEQVTSTKSTIVLQTVKETTVLPIENKQFAANSKERERKDKKL